MLYDLRWQCISFNFSFIQTPCGSGDHQGYVRVIVTTSYLFGKQSFVNIDWHHFINCDEAEIRAFYQTQIQTHTDARITPCCRPGIQFPLYGLVMTPNYRRVYQQWVTESRPPTKGLSLREAVPLSTRPLVKGSIEDETSIQLPGASANSNHTFIGVSALAYNVYCCSC